MQHHAATLALVGLIALPPPPLPPQDPTYVTDVIPPDVVTLDNVKTAEHRLKGKKRARPDLGIRFGGPSHAGIAVRQVRPRGPAAKAGLIPGDIVRSIGKVRTADLTDLERSLAWLRISRPVKLSVLRPAIRKDAVIRYGPGEKVGDAGFSFKKSRGVFLVTAVERGKPAFRAGLEVGDTFRRFDRTVLKSSGAARRILRKRKQLTVRVERSARRFGPKLEPVPAQEEKPLDWKGKKFDLAVVLVEFADVKHNPHSTPEAVERMLFSVGEYRRAPDGRPTYGSMRDYYREISVDQFDVEGKVFDWVEVRETWAYYDEQDMGRGDGSRRTIFQDALAAVRRRHGPKALAPYEGVVFLYAGERRSLRGSQLWPHRSSVEIRGKSRPYYIVEEGGQEFTSIGVHCHEFGHMLGLPDFYGYGHRTGVGKFCTMAIGHKGAGESASDRPFHFCAWCKIRLGWLTPRTIHPGDRQHVALRPVNGSTSEALKVLISPSGDEYFLLEVRRRVGFDADFFGNGLLIWHVGEDGQPEKGQISVAIDLEEAHGKSYFDASLREEAQALFPSRNTDAFTPRTYPNSTSNLGSAHTVEITGIRVFQPGEENEFLPPGTVFFRVGDKRRAAALDPVEPEQPVYPRDEPVIEDDPVTELPVPFTIGKDNVAKPGPNIMPRPKKEDDDKKGKKGKKKGGRASGP